MIAALAAAACAWLAWRPHAGQHQDAAARWLRDGAVVAVATMGVGFWAGVMAAVVLRMVVPRLESRDRSATQALDRADALHLSAALAVCHSAGVSGPGAWDAAAAVLQGPAHDVCTRLARDVSRGASYDEALVAVVGAEPLLADLCHALRRAHHTGAPAATALLGIARQQSAEVHSIVLQRVRQLGVRAALPLGLCFLPAFVLIGVVPLAAGLL